MIFLSSFLSVDDDEILCRLLASVELAHEVVIVSNQKQLSVMARRTKQSHLPPPSELIIIALDACGGGGIRGGGA